MKMNRKILDISSDENSQNFILRLTNSAIINETLEDDLSGEKQSKNDDVIIIHDSSDENSLHLPDDNSNRHENHDQDKLLLKSSKFTMPNGKKSNKVDNVSISSFDDSDIFTEDGTKNCWWQNTNSTNGNNMVDKSRSGEKDNCNLITKINSNFKAKKFTDSNNSGSSHNSVQKIINTNNDSNELYTHSPRQKIQQKLNILKAPLNNVNKLVDNSQSCDTPKSGKFDIKTTPLTKKEARNILKTVKSKRVVYDSPGQWVRNESNDINSDSHSSGESAKNSPVKIIHPAWIDETESESDTPKHVRIQHNNNSNNKNSNSNHINRLEEEARALIERKNREVSRWLMLNSFNVRSDTSMSCVLPSEKNSINDGNSSLERLEEDYETPNNRDKIKFKDKKIVDEYLDKLNVENSATKSIRLDKSASGSGKKLIPKNSKKLTPVSITKTGVQARVSPLIENDTNCANILDKIYGKSWRDTVEVTPTVADKKMLLLKPNRVVQSERKIDVKSKLNSKKNIPECNVNSVDRRIKVFAKNINSINPGSSKQSTSTKIVKKQIENDLDFINDVSSSNSDGETTYMTALTTPALPRMQSRLKKNTPMSALTKKAIELCDSDTEDSCSNDEKNRNNLRRQLDFDDDKNSLSSNGTSEYDPYDVLPPKATSTLSTLSRIKASPVLRPGSANSNSVKRKSSKESFLKSLSSSVPIAHAHPDAIKFRTNFKNNREVLCKYLFKYFNDKVFENKLPNDMLIEWSTRMRGTAGFCYNKSKKKAFGDIERSARIQLATKVLDSPDRLRDTLIHEMCHAATWIVDNVLTGHGPCWKAWAIRSMKVFPELPSIKRCHDYKVATKYTYRCITCGYSIGRHSKSLDTARKRCGHCFGKFELLVNKTTKSGTVQKKVDNEKPATGFALFVKENYHSVKSKYYSKDHKDIMKVLGQQFSALKISKQDVEND